MAELVRNRAREAERGQAEANLVTALARELLSGSATAIALPTVARLLAEVLGLRSAALELGVRTGDDRRRALALSDQQGNQLATLLVPSDLPPDTARRLQRQVVPPLAALLAVAIQRDALQSEAVETAALRRSDDVKTAVLRAVSHDLRTPLTAIVAAGHALGTTSLSPEERDELSAAVVGEGERLAGLVDKLLDLSKLQAGRAEPRRDWIWLEDVLVAAQEQLAERRDGVRLIIDPSLPPVRADAAQLERAFANLLENARRYSNGLPVSVHARVSGERVVVRVVDQGPGIDPAQRDRIFEPFYRGPDAGGGRWTGSGLGLAVAKGFVELSGGTIAVESLPGQGTSFVVSLPLESAREKTPVPK
jgi:two-component system sensor histidine kinase KdpD